MSPARVLSGITAFYDEGIKPKGNVSYSLARLPKAEYAILSSEISDRQFHKHRPSFDFAYTYHNFYVYTYLDYGNFVVNFAANIEVDRELINLILKGFRNGTIYSPRTLNSLFEEIQSRRERYSGDILDAVEEYLGNGIISTLLRGSKSNEVGGVPEDGSHRSEEVTNGGENRRGASLENSTEDSYR